MLSNPLAVPRAAFSPAPAAPPVGTTTSKQPAVTRCNLYSSVGLETNTNACSCSELETNTHVRTAAPPAGTSPKQPAVTKVLPHTLQKGSM
jgi:hypothetical protein